MTPTPSMSRAIALSGASGLLGSAMAPALAAAGWQVRPLVRRTPGPGEIRWDPAAGTIDASALAGVSAAVHLAGESIAEGRWTPARKARIRSSRILGSRLLSESLARLPVRPDVLVSASAVGIYGDRGDELLDENSPLGTDFLAEVGKEWEGATAPASDAGIRVVHLRFGIILSKEGGALPRMVTPFQLGAGGPIGNGRQWMSWIAIDDAVTIVLEALRNKEMRGPFNAVAPDPVRNADFAARLGEVLHRPALVPAPAFALRLLFGEMADAALLASQRAVPARLTALGFSFRHPTLAEALRTVLDR
ncbi:MAG TPA: TIGR01777 family oxidoreductase [Gemmatimonadales bacterium]|nr:TIGR01777 family oxidoreductase [Gemmatimonadales bacterium]HRZ10323.1 TIGR01777 family oxidoreductase [Gemmatimonadales bacterium]